MGIKEEWCDILLRQTMSQEPIMPQEITILQEITTSRKTTKQEITGTEEAISQEIVIRHEVTTHTENILENHDSENKTENDFNLLDLLNSSEEGKLLLSTYSALSDFTDEERLKLAVIVLGHEMRSIRKRTTRQSFHFLAEKIVETFPTEKKEVWAADAITPSGRVALTGKFSNPYVWSKIMEVRLKNNLQDGEKDLLNLCKEVESKHRTGETNWEEVWPTLEVIWRNTTKYRIQKLYHTKDVFHDYFRKYPFLAEPMGFTLLEKDFEYLYPKATCNLFAEWPKLSSFFENLLNDRLPRGIARSPERRMMTILTNLSWIFPVICVKKKWRPTRSESQFSFLLVIKRYESLKPFLDVRASKLSSLGVKYMPPLPVVVGGRRNKFEACYVVFDKAIYKVDNPLKAIDLTFKMFYSLRIPYPPECMQIWTFLQQAVYKIVTKADRKHPKTSDLISKYEKFKVCVK